jgi:AraC family transcriptional regulator
MPKSSSGGRVLRGGEFYSQVARRESREEMFLSELRQPQPCQMPRHEHELAYLTVVLAGDYAESDACGTTELRPFTAIFNPAGVSHTGAVGMHGATLFTIELRSDFLAQLQARVPTHPVADCGSGAIFWAGLRAYSAFKARAGDLLTIESHVLEMLAALDKDECKPRGKAAPLWFQNLKERLRADYQHNLSMAELAAQAGVHPVHLARVFRSQLGQTPGDYVRHLRVRTACDLLRDREFPLAAIAAECGFADQSHFTRIFKRAAGTTPGEFRKLHAAG